MLNHRRIVGGGLAPESTALVQVATLNQDLHVEGSCGDGLGERSVSLRPLLPVHKTPRAGRRLGTMEDRIEPAIETGLTWTSHALESCPALEPGRIVEDLDQALLRVERQAGDHLDPGGHELQVIG